MSEDRNRLDERTKLAENDETENEDVEAHKLAAQIDPESTDDDVEAHKLA